MDALPARALRVPVHRRVRSRLRRFGAAFEVRRHHHAVGRGASVPAAAVAGGGGGGGEAGAVPQRRQAVRSRSAKPVRGHGRHRNRRDGRSQRQEVRRGWRRRDCRGVGGGIGRRVASTAGVGLPGGAPAGTAGSSAEQRQVLHPGLDSAGGGRHDGAVRRGFRGSHRRVLQQQPRVPAGSERCGARRASGDVVRQRRRRCAAGGPGARTISKEGRPPSRPRSARDGSTRSARRSPSAPSRTARSSSCSTGSTRRPGREPCRRRRRPDASSRTGEGSGSTAGATRLLPCPFYRFSASCRAEPDGARPWPWRPTWPWLLVSRSCLGPACPWLAPSHAWPPGFSGPARVSRFWRPWRCSLRLWPRPSPSPPWQRGNAARHLPHLPLRLPDGAPHRATNRTLLDGG